MGNSAPALFGGGLVFAGCWYCWRQGWIGGGDVKLLSACALLVPPASVPELVLTTAIAGGVLALFYLAPRATAAARRNNCNRSGGGRLACSDVSGALSGAGSAAACRCLMPAQSPPACC